MHLGKKKEKKKLMIRGCHGDYRVEVKCMCRFTSWVSLWLMCGDIEEAERLHARKFLVSFSNRCNNVEIALFSAFKLQLL